MTRRQRGAGGAVAPHSRDLVAASFEGPLPPPSMLEHYNEIVPGAAERILAMAEQNGEHRRGLESYAVRAEHRRSIAGLVAGSVVAVAMLGCGTWVTLEGHAAVGIAIIGLDVGSIVGTFVYGSERRRSERVERTKMMTGRN